jgi:hypothetical protein
MKNLILFSMTGMVATAVLAADSDPQAAVRDAAKQLGEKPNYSWTSKGRSEAGGIDWNQGPTEGKTEKDGYTFFSVTFNDNPIECAFKGTKSAIKIESDWESSDELTGDREWVAGRLKAFKAPAGEAADLLSRVKELKTAEEGVYSADLTEEGVKKLLATMGRGGQTPEVKNPKGWVKFWLKDGALAKYEFNLQGKFNGRDGEEVTFNRTTSVEIKNVGGTTVHVPEEAKKKLT